MNMQNENGETSMSEIVGSESGLIMEDRIGQLPEDVIGFLLSRLTLEEAGRTSVLSRRWKNMWSLRLTSCLNFDAWKIMVRFKREQREYIESKRKEYVRWVNKVVDNYRGTNLDEFVVVFQMDSRHSTHLDNWISFAVKNRAKAIKIDLFPLFRIDANCYSFMRSAASLPGIECLTSLELGYVKTTAEVIEHLLLVCPLLERLCLDIIFFPVEHLNLRVVGPSLKLKYLKLKYLNVLLSHWTVNIAVCAPNLVSFHSRKSSKTKLRVEGLCSLTELDVDASNLMKFSSYFSQLETLTIVSDSYLTSRLKMISKPGPRLTSLKHLTIKLTSSVISDTSYLTRVINSCPFLHKFTLELREYVMDRVNSSRGDSCSHQYLKVVEITRFIGGSEHMKIAEYFLRFNSLEKLIIDTRSYCYKDSWPTVEPESRQKAEELRRKVLDGVEFLVL